MGRPAYEPWLTEEGLARVVEWVSEGRPDKQIAKIMDISRVTLWRWRKEHETLDNAFKTGREAWFDSSLPEVENAGFKLATGYTYKETTEELKDVGGTLQLVVTKVVTKHVAPNALANMYWLQNRASNMWKDRRNQQPEQDESGETGVVAIAPVKEGGDA